MSGRRGSMVGGNGTGAYGYKELRRTPSTSAIYETLRRSKELRESLTRPSSRLSMDEKIRDSVSDLQFLSAVNNQLNFSRISPREGVIIDVDNSGSLG